MDGYRIFVLVIFISTGLDQPVGYFYVTSSFCFNIKKKNNSDLNLNIPIRQQCFNSVEATWLLCLAIVESENLEVHYRIETIELQTNFNMVRIGLSLSCLHMYIFQFYAYVISKKLICTSLAQRFSVSSGLT